MSPKLHLYYNVIMIILLFFRYFFLTNRCKRKCMWRLICSREFMNVKIECFLEEKDVKKIHVILL